MIWNFFTKEPVMTALVLVLMLAGLRILTEGPPPKPASLPAGHFSADRAYDLLGELLEGIGAHPAGSAPNKLLRERLVKKLSALGLSPELQQDFHCSPLAPGCSYLENVIAILPGSNPSRKALMATAHYDSAPAAGGAADDGAGIAALLEIITNLKASDPLENDVIFLFSDAEESGLRGAMAFNKKHPLMDRVGMILNMEARGVSGPSLMFETGPRNYRQVQGFANSTPRPVSTSLLVEIYKRMPNGTDLMAYAERGLPALNFAFSRGVSLYHSPHDTIENLSKSSLQHHGDNMLAAIRHFGNTDLESLHSDSDATYIDFFGYFLIMWPAHLSIWIAGAALAGLIFVAIRQNPAPIKILWALLAVILISAATVATGWILSFPLGNWGDSHPLDHPYPWPGRIALIATGLLLPALVLRLLARKLDEKALFQVVWGIYALAAVLCSLTLSGASYIFIIPLLGAVLAAVVLSFRQPQSSLKVKVACYVGSALAAYMAFYHFMLLDVVVNFHMSHLKVIPLLLLSLAALPLMLTWRQAGSDHGLLVGTGLVAALATLAASMMPAYTPERPRSTNIIYRADVSSGTYQWQLFTYGPDDRHYLQKADFPDEKFPYHDFGYKPRTGYLKPAPDLKLEAPGFTLISDTTKGKIRMITATLHYGRNAMLSGIGFPPEMKLHTLEVSGQRVLDAPNSAAPHALFMGSDPEGLPMRLTVEAGTAVEFRIFDMTPLSLTGEAATLHALRPANTAPMHFGDHSIVSRTINLGE